MSEDDVVEIVVSELAESAAGRAGRAMLRLIGVKSMDVEGEIRNYLLSEVPRLWQELKRIDRSKIAEENLRDIILQTLLNYLDEAKEEKRRLMTNVAVNGFRAEDYDPVMHRLFVRAVAELEPEHVDVLNRLTSSWENPRGVVFLWELVARGFVTRSVTGGELQQKLDEQVWKKRKETYSRNAYGTKFLEYLMDPQEFAKKMDEVKRNAEEKRKRRGQDGEEES